MKTVYFLIFALIFAHGANGHAGNVGASSQLFGDWAASLNVAVQKRAALHQFADGAFALVTPSGSRNALYGAAAPDIEWVARLGAAAPDPSEPPKPLYLSAPSAKPQAFSLGRQ